MLHEAGTGRTAPSRRPAAAWRAGGPRVRALFYAAALLSLHPAVANPALLGDDTVAGFVQGFLRFTEWPDAAFQGDSDRLRLCVDAASTRAAAMRRLDGMTFSGRTVSVIAHPRPWSPECHVAFVGAATGAVGRALNEAPPRTLLISDAAGFVARGGAIGIVGADPMARFEVNAEALSRTGLRVSSHLLRLAVTVAR